MPLGRGYETSFEDLVEEIRSLTPEICYLDRESLDDVATELSASYMVPKDVILSLIERICREELRHSSLPRVRVKRVEDSRLKSLEDDLIAVGRELIDAYLSEEKTREFYWETEDRRYLPCRLLSNLDFYLKRGAERAVTFIAAALSHVTKSVALMVLSLGNIKVGDIPYTTALAYITCPGRTEVCSRICYANKPVWSVIVSQTTRTLISLYGQYPELMKRVISSKVVEPPPGWAQKVIRLHEAGDFYDERYARD